MILLVVLGCAPSSEGRDSETEPAELTTGDVRYLLAWDTAGITLGDGWTAAADGGWSVHVTQASLTSYAASMVQCVDIVARRPSPILSLIIGVAYAGHDGLTDPSTLEAPIIEDLAAPAETLLGEVAFDTAAYCRVHWLVASATLDTRGLDTSPWMMDRTLALEAEATGPNGERRVLSLASASPVGGLADVDAGVDGPADVRIVRSLGTAFVGVDFVDDADADIAWAVLSNLGHDARVVVSGR